MNTDDDVRAPALDNVAQVTDAPFMKKLARIRTDAVDDPVVILHPVLTVAQDPVVQPHQLVSEMMRFFDRAHDSHRIRFAVEKLLHAGNDRSGRGAMSTAGVRRDD